MEIHYYPYRNYEKKIRTLNDEEALAGLPPEEQERAKRDLYSFVSLCPYPKMRKMFVGTTHRYGDILLEFDVERKIFRSCGYAESGLRGDGEIKIHKGLNLDPRQDAIYFGTATLKSIAESMDDEGGKFIRYDIHSGVFALLGAPTPGEYYQNTCYDPLRGLMYAFTLRNSFVVYDLHRKKLRRKENMQSSPHNGCIAPGGKLWGVCDVFRQEFFKYDPDQNAFEFPGVAVPNALAAANIMYLGAGPVDSFVDGGDGYLYLGTPLGELYRIDYAANAIRYLGKPFSDQRLPGLAVGDDGWLYLSGGSRPASMLARYHRGEERFEYLGAIEHPDGARLHYVHEIAVMDGVIYAAETDNPGRSGFLWTCDLT